MTKKNEVYKCALCGKPATHMLLELGTSSPRCTACAST